MSLPATHDIHIFGSINGVDFDMVGAGKGDPKNGTLDSSVKSNKGALPFSPFLVGPNLGYGLYQYLPFPGGVSPFQAAVTDGGYQLHRNFRFEDGAVLNAHYRYVYEGSNIKGEFRLVGSGFPAKGPVMTNSLATLDRSVAKMMCADDHTITGTNNWSYRTKSGGSYKATVQTNYTFAKPIPDGVKEIMPIFLFHKVDVNASETDVTLAEKMKAFSEL